MTIKRRDNVGIIVEHINAAIEFFAELDLVLEESEMERAWSKV